MVLATKSAISFPLLSTCCMKILGPDVIKIMCQADHTSRTERKEEQRKKEYDRKKEKDSWQIKFLKTTRCQLWGDCIRFPVQSRSVRRGILYGGCGSEPPEQLSGLHSANDIRTVD